MYPTNTESGKQAQTSLIISALPASRDYLLRLVDCAQIFPRTLCVRDPDEALNLLEEDPVDIIFFDWEPPGLTDLDGLTEKLHSRDEWRDIPLILFTSDQRRDMEIKALQHGACDCLSYGITARELNARLSPHLSHKQRADTLREENNQLAKLAITDRLTGLYNRAYFDVVLEFETARNQRCGSVLSLLMITIDQFGWLDENYGHKASDSLLRMIGDIIHAETRHSDIPCRFNHQDFAIILPDTPTPEAYTLAEKIRREIAERGPKKPLSHFTLSISMGISGDTGQGDSKLYDLIDEAYCAVETGRRHGAGRTEIFCQNLEIFTPYGDRVDLEHPQGNA